MRLALLGDIHGNAAALAAVLDAARREGVERLLITGDLVGYYFAPAAVLALLASWEAHIVRGNHEEMLIAARADRQVLTAVSARYGDGIRCALAQLTPAQLDRLCALPHPLALEMEGCRILLCHGTPDQVDRYLYPDAAPEQLAACCMDGFDVVVMGHTHYSMNMPLGKARLVNPGSVGQPRNRRPGAHWALLDTVSTAVELRVEDYDRSALVRECRLRHPELPYLADILERR